MATILTNTGITFPDSTTQTSAEIISSSVGSASLPSSNVPSYFCTGLTTSLKQASFFVASATLGSGPASIGIAIKASSNSNNNIYGYKTRITGTTVSSTNVSNLTPSSSVYLIAMSGAYQAPNTWEVKITRSNNSTVVQTYVITYQASSSTGLILHHGILKFTGTSNTHITDIGLYQTHATAGSITGATGFKENY